MHELSMRQRKILCLVAKGKTNRQIANELDVKESLVAEEVRRMNADLAVDNRMSLVIMALKLGEIELDEIDV